MLLGVGKETGTWGTKGLADGTWDGGEQEVALSFGPCLSPLMGDLIPLNLWVWLAYPRRLSPLVLLPTPTSPFFFFFGRHWG
jgi:hypothetical protein